MPKPARVEVKPTPPPPTEAPVGLMHPLFGVTKGLEPGKWLAVRLVNGVVEVLTPPRGGRHTGEQLHFATARVVDSFKTSVLKGKLA